MADPREERGDAAVEPAVSFGEALRAYNPAIPERRPNGGRGLASLDRGVAPATSSRTGTS